MRTRAVIARAIRGAEKESAKSLQGMRALPGCSPRADVGRYSATRSYPGFMSEQRIKELEEQLLAAQGSIAELTKANATLTASLAEAGLALKRSRRNARQDGNTLRDEISSLQNRRG